MYTTKRLNQLSQSMVGDKVGFLAEKEPYKEFASKNSRHKGKQFQTNPAKRTDGGGGFFAKKTYTPEEYNDRLMYTKNQPLDSRKLGFGSHNAKNRDEFTLHIRTEQYRELLKAEKKALRLREGGKVEEDDEDDAADSFWETSAAEIGSGAKAVDLNKPTHGRVAVTKEFYDRGHLHS